MATSTQSEEQIRLMIDASPEVILRVDEHGIIAQTNARAAEMFGYTLAELTGKPMEILVPERFRKGHMQIRATYMDHPVERRMGRGRDLIALRKDGTEFPAEIALTPILFGAQRNVLATLTDISVRKEVEDAVRKARDRAAAASLAKSRFIGKLSLDMSAPMDGMMHMLAILLAQVKSDQDRLPLLLAETSAQTMVNVFNTIVSLSKLEFEPMARRRFPIEPAKFLPDRLRYLRRSAAVKGLAFSVKVSADIPPTVYGDDVWLGQILMNLVENAIKFTEKGSVEVDAGVQSREADKITLLFRVTDTGEGILHEQHESIFEGFSQAASPAPTPGAPVHLGLAITRELVEEMGGRLWLESEKSKGSTFFCAIPFDLQAAPGAKD
jgi:PAS domain S-box-containing protein